MKRIVLLFVLLLGVRIYTIAQGDLLIFPTRIVFEGNKQREEISLVNIGKDTATYSITFVHRKMNEDGSFSIIEKPDSGLMFAEPFLRIFPRQVTLAPREPQVIMLQFRRNADMHNGEYRSHLNFASEKYYKPLDINKSAKDTTKLSVEIVPIIGISIPIILRVGSINVNSTISNLNLETPRNDSPILNLTINRTGNCSTFGDLIVDYVPKEGKSFIVGKLKSVAVYTDINKKNVSITLNKVKGVVFKTGNLRVRYSSSSDDSKYLVLAEAVLSITEQIGIVQEGENKDNNGQ